MRLRKDLVSASPAVLGGVFATLMIGLAGIGGILNYSAIPYWDTWGAIINMMIRLHNGDTAVWWAQHNEHRLVLTRALAWIDFEFFDGMSYSLIIINYVIPATSALIFYFFMKQICRSSNENKWTANSSALIYFIFGSLFFWIQIENFTWGLNSNFFIAQLTPLTAFYYLAKSVSSASWPDFWIASLLGILSAGTLAVGLVILPLMFAYALVLRQGLPKILILAGISIAVLAWYSSGYVLPGNRDSMGSTLIHHPIGVFSYAMKFLGSPFSFLVGGGRLGQLVALNSGIAFTIVFCALVRRWLFTVEKSPFTAALLFFIAYIGASALASAAARLANGEASAFASRYTTPAIMAWMALLLLLWHRAGDRPATNSRRHLILFMGVGALMLAYQTKTLRDASETLFPREVAALALSLDINDEAAIKIIYPSAARALMLSQAAKPLGLSFFGQPPYAGLWQEMGAPLALPDGPACLGALEAATPVAGAPAYVRVTGWLFDPQTRTTPRIVRFIGDQSLVEGIAVVGKKRRNIGTDSHAKYAGFVGYMRAGSAGTTVIATGGGAGCRISFPVPPLG